MWRADIVTCGRKFSRCEAPDHTARALRSDYDADPFPLLPLGFIHWIKMHLARQCPGSCFAILSLKLFPLQLLRLSYYDTSVQCIYHTSFYAIL